MSEFDTLLDFGATENPKENGSDHNHEATDEFDPFGPSPTVEAKGGVGAGDLLVDFSVDSQVSSQENGLGGQVELSVNSNMADNVNPLYELEQASEGESSNPLYEMSREEEQIRKEEPSNPLYDFMSDEKKSNGQEAENNEVDLLGTTGTNFKDLKQLEEPLVQTEQPPEVVQTEQPPEVVECEEQEEPEQVHKEEEPEQTEQRPRSHSSSSASSVEEREDVGELVITEEPAPTEVPVVEVPQPRPRQSRSSSKSSSASEEHETEEQVTGDDSLRKEETHISETMPEDHSGDASSPNKISSPGDAIQENGFDEPVHDPNIARETREKEEVHFRDMSSIAYKFEMGQVSTDREHEKSPIREDFGEGGVYENEPTVDPNVVRASDKVNVGEELPEVGTAKNILAKFKTIQSEQPKPSSKKIDIRSPGSGPTELVSEPRAVHEQYVPASEAGVYESNPLIAEDVIRSEERVEEIMPQQGMAKNVAARFKQLESEVGNKPPPSPTLRAITPDRVTGKVEFVSEPRSTFEGYEGKSDAGIFESEPAAATNVIKYGEYVEEAVPEKGTARNLVSKFKQLESEVTNKPPPSPKRELTPDRSGKVEYISEPRGHVEKFEGKSDAGVFENQPSDREDIVKSSAMEDNPMYERGYAKNVADKFREIQKHATSPPDEQRRAKEFTPPHDPSHVYENSPMENPDVVRETYAQEAPLPEKGTAKNLASKFRQLSIDANTPRTSVRTREFTPPKESGVYENDPSAPLVAKNAPAESGILENQPHHRQDVARYEHSDYVDSNLPESGHAKNLLNKFRQIESESGKVSPSRKYKEFTPPRDEPRIQALLSPRSPAGGTGGSVSPSDLPGQYQQHTQAGVYESQPQEREDVEREQESDWLIGMPQGNVTKGMLNKFKEIQSQAKQAQEVPKPTQKGGKKPGWARQKAQEQSKDEKGLFLAVTTEKCASCQKTVYAMERMEMNKNVYHRACFKCSHCKARLTPGTYSLNEGVMYCTTHFKQLFARKGNYDEGFGREQYKKKWKSEPNLFNISITDTEVQT
ncbi:hypothetical protein ScPMuIL_016146 [Solemya velum]